jgi:hypothetical protein
MPHGYFGCSTNANISVIEALTRKLLDEAQGSTRGFQLASYQGASGSELIR